MKQAVLLDSSFWVRLFEINTPLSEKALSYLHLIEKANIQIALSTIVIAEFCVRSSFETLPLSKVAILGFEENHALRAAQFAAIAFSARRHGALETSQRLIIPNDVKLFAQADSEPAIKYFISSDTESLKIYQSLSKENPLNFEFIDLNQPLSNLA